MKTILTLAFFSVAGLLLAGNFVPSLGDGEAKMPIVELKPNEDIFEKLKSNQQSVVVDFYADWCGPCRSQSEILKAAVENLPTSNVRVIKVNVDRHSELAAQLQVSSIPALFVVKDGKVIDHHVGVANKEQINQWLNE